MAIWKPAPGRKVNRYYAFKAYCNHVRSAEDHENVMKGIRGYNHHRLTWSDELKDRIPNFENWLDQEKYSEFTDPAAEQEVTANNPLAPKGKEVVLGIDD